MTYSVLHQNGKEANSFYVIKTFIFITNFHIAFLSKNITLHITKGKKKFEQFKIWVNKFLLSHKKVNFYLWEPVLLENKALTPVPLFIYFNLHIYKWVS